MGSCVVLRCKWSAANKSVAPAGSDVERIGDDARRF